MQSPNRRLFLKQATLALPTLLAGGAWLSGQEAIKSSFPGMIVRSTEPQNLEYPFSSLNGPITPNEHFYVRNHFAAPRIEMPSWRLKVQGAVRQPLDLSYDDLLKLPSTTLTATLECAGNGRVFLTPQPQGTLWGLGAVSTAKWKGIALATLLERAGVKDGAVEVILEGADRGTVANPPSPGAIAFARSLPLKKATQPEVLLAYQMNDAYLAAAHGYPLRAVIGGWYGMASVKWLMRVIVADKLFQGFFQTLDYSYFERRDGHPTLVPITRMEVKALIARPACDEVIPAGQPYRVFGAAWSGETPIAKVEVSTDGGRSWATAKVMEKSTETAWGLWEYTWQVPAAKGPAKLMARATDAHGRTQPLERDPDRRHYMISHLVPVDVLIK
jgi:DMSO/TMAO reductase YedYZ molybdopterin-dependent catalytic subunit